MLMQENNKDLIFLINHRMTISQHYEIGIEKGEYLHCVADSTDYTLSQSL